MTTRLPFMKFGFFTCLLGTQWNFKYSPEFGRWHAGEGTNLDRRLVPYTRDARRIKSRIEFIL